jgi:4-aminobutyrate aminotransferase-like enzyme
MQHYDVVPDLMTIAKSLAGGLPLSGVVGRADIMDAAQPGGLGGTYAGNPLATAAAHAVLEIIEEEQLSQRAEVLGQKLKARLETLKATVPQIADVRGPGSMVAAEFNDPATGAPSPEFTKQVQTRALERGLLLLSCGVYGNVIRFLFPLTIPMNVFDEALDILEEALTAKATATV